MTKYHINPETGRANKCEATVRDCAYAADGKTPEHYDSKDEAKAAYETSATNEFGATSTFAKAKKGEKPKKQYFIYVDCVGRNVYSATKEEIAAGSDQTDFRGNIVGFGWCDRCNDMDSQVGSIFSDKEPTREQLDAFLSS